MLATEFLNRNIHLSAHIDMAWLLRHTMSKPFTTQILNLLFLQGTI